jgi:hypothetical protein
MRSNSVINSNIIVLLSNIFYQVCMNIDNLISGQLLRVDSTTTSTIQNGVERKLSRIIQSIKNVDHLIKSIDGKIAIDMTIQRS